MSDLTTTIEEVSEAWMQAWIDQDLAALEEFLAPDYSLVVSSVPGHVFDRANWLQTAVGPYVCTRLSYEGVQVRDLGDGLAVMSGIADFDATMAGIDRSGRYFLTDIWRRAPGSSHGWQVCARFSSQPGEADASVREMTRT
jgi:ketosteroid isomerase-like protein